MFDEIVFNLVAIYFSPVKIMPYGSNHIPHLQSVQFVLIIIYKINIGLIHSGFQDFGDVVCKRVTHDAVTTPQYVSLEYAAHLVIRFPVAGPRTPGVPMIDSTPIFKVFAVLIPPPGVNVHYLFIRIHVNAVREQLHNIFFTAG